MYRHDTNDMIFVYSILLLTFKNISCQFSDRKNDSLTLRAFVFMKLSIYAYKIQIFSFVFIFPWGKGWGFTPFPIR